MVVLAPACFLGRDYFCLTDIYHFKVCDSKKGSDPQIFIIIHCLVYTALTTLHAVDRRRQIKKKESSAIFNEVNTSKEVLARQQLKLKPMYLLCFVTAKVFRLTQEYCACN